MSIAVIENFLMLLVLNLCLFSFIENLFSEAQMCDLRDAYVRLLDFTSLSFDEGLRCVMVSHLQTIRSFVVELIT